MSAREPPPLPSADALPTAAEQRLHPWSWLFVLVQQLKQFILPLIALVVFGGRGDPDNLWANLGPVIAVGVLVVVSVVQYFTYRYRIGRDGLTIRSGWLHRSLREIPFARIHNVGIHQSLLHRLFQVAEVRLESAGGQKPEAEMRVLSLSAANALENLIRHRGQAASSAAADAPATPASSTLLALPLAEVIRLGLASNRGMVVVAAAFGLAWQVLPDRMMARLLQRYSREAFGYASHLEWTWQSGALAALAIVALVVGLTRLLSVLLAVVQFHGFRLSESDRRLTVERGLLTRLRNSVARRRIQAWTLREGVVQRWLKRRSLHVDTAVASRVDHDDGRALKVLAPIATPDACDALVRHLLPHSAWPPASWRPLPVQAAWRLWLPGLILTPLLALALWFPFGAWAAPALLLWPLSGWAAWQNARRSGYAAGDELIAVRGGWWWRWWRFAEVDKLQALRLTRSPMDRWLGTATLWLDTAGDRGLSPPLRLRFLPDAEVEALYLRLAASLAHRRLRW